MFGGCPVKAPKPKRTTPWRSCTTFSAPPFSASQALPPSAIWLNMLPERSTSRNTVGTVASGRTSNTRHVPPSEGLAPPLPGGVPPPVPGETPPPVPGDTVPPVPDDTRPPVPAAEPPAPVVEPPAPVIEPPAPVVEPPAPVVVSPPEPATTLPPVPPTMAPPPVPPDTGTSDPASLLLTQTLEKHVRPVLHVAFA